MLDLPVVVWQLKTRITYRQGRLLNNCQSQPLGNASLMHALEMETEQQFMVVYILALATSAVSRHSLLDP